MALLAKGQGTEVIHAAAQVGILPENGPETVARAAKALGYPLDTVIRLAAPADSGLAQPCTGAHMLRLALRLPSAPASSEGADG